VSSERAFNVKMEDGLGIITFDVIGSPMNTWSEDTVMEFLELLEGLKKDETLKGLIFISGKPNAFFAGADLKLFTLLKTREETGKAISYFRNAFDEISALKIPTMAAIQGFCVGGGLELTLACTAWKRRSRSSFTDCKERTQRKNGRGNSDGPSGGHGESGPRSS